MRVFHDLILLSMELELSADSELLVDVNVVNWPISERPRRCSSSKFATSSLEFVDIIINLFLEATKIWEWSGFKLNSCLERRREVVAPHCRRARSVLRLRRWNKGDDTEATFVDDDIINEDADNEQVVMVVMTMMEEMMLVDVMIMAASWSSLHLRIS